MADDLGVQNVMRGTAEYVLQVGHVHGNVHVYLPPDADPVERAAQALARSVRAQWTAELNAWDLATAEPLPVRWLASWPDPPGSHDPPDPPGSPNPPDPPGSPDSPNPSDPPDSPDSPDSPGSPDDRIATVADAFLGLGHRRLVVLGGPGAGKSTFAVLLALELADRSLPPHRTPPDADDMARPVPVVLTLESWDPRQEHFHTWLARRIAEEHPGLPRIDGGHPAARLIQERRVVPVLDGLDELPEHRRPLVVQGIDRDLGRHDAVVLASRTREYRAGEAAGAAVARAAVIEAQPVGLADATAYLLASAVPQLRREWKLLLDAADREPDGPVALALSSPLMIWLARRGLRTPPSDPSELLRLPSPTRDSVERHLLDLILPAVFAEQPHAPDRLHAPGQWSADRARHWLRYLARHLTNLRTTELSWWDLHRATLVRTLALPTLLLVCVALSGIYGAASDWFAAERAAGQPFGGWPSLTSLTLQSALTGGMLFGMVVWLAVENWFGFRRGKPRRRANPFKIGAALRSAGRGASVRRAAKAAAVIVVPTAIFGAITLSVADPRPYLVMLLCSTVLAPLLMVTIAAPSDTEDASTPDEVLRGERTAALLSLATVAVLIGLGQGAHGWLQEGGDDMGWAKAVAGWFGASVMLLLMSQWSRWLLAKGWLATVGRVPWSLMEFLRDAHRGGLLQRSGGVYRFRHLRLQEHLADRIASASPVVAPAGPLREPLVRHGQPPPAPPMAPAAPAPTFRDLLDESERMPLSERKGWTVHSDARVFRAEGRERRFPLGHWPLILLFMTMHVIRTTTMGNWGVALLQMAAWICLGLLIMLVFWLRPPQLWQVVMTPEHIEFAMGRRRGRMAWSDVQAIGLRKLVRRKSDTKVYALQLRPVPGAPPLARFFRCADGWFLVMVLGTGATVPSDLAAGLERFAGARWQPPGNTVGRTVRNDVSGQARAGGVIQTGVVRGDVTLGRQDPRAPRGRDRNTDPDRDPDRAPGRSTDREG